MGFTMCNCKWEPISSAPRDGTEFLAIYPHQACVTALVSFCPVHKIWKSKGKALLGFENQEPLWHPITLPTPPTTDLADAGKEEV